MSLPRDCRTAQVQLSLRQSGELDLAEQRALETHLSRCERCRALQSSSATLADLLRRSTPPLEPSTRAALWQRIEADSARGAGSTAGSRSWLLGVGLAALAAALLLALWPAARKPAAPVRGVAAPRVAATTGHPAQRRVVVPRRFHVIAQAQLLVDGAAARSTAPLDALAELEVGSGGAALIASDDALVLVEEGTRLRIGEGGATLSLEQGRLHVRTRAAGRQRGRVELSVLAGELSAEPVGTHYSVTRGPGAAVIDVHEGRVIVTRGAQLAATTLGAGQAFSSRGARVAPSSAPLALGRLEALVRSVLSRSGSSRAKRPPRALVPGRLGCIEIAGVKLPCSTRAARSAATAPTAALSPTLTKASAAKASAALSPTLTKASAAKASAAKASAAKTSAAKTSAAAGSVEPSAAVKLDCKTRPLERLLAAGKTAEARAAAQARRGRCPRAAALMSTIVAESLAREGKHDAARDAYLALFLERPKTQLGMSALYMAGSIELEQKRRPAVAAKLFRSYLKRYPVSPQRQDAFYMLWRAYSARGDKAKAKATAKRYRAAYPHGRYRSRMR